MLSGAVFCLPFSRIACHLFLLGFLIAWFFADDLKKKKELFFENKPVLLLAIFSIYTIVGLVQSPASDIPEWIDRKFFLLILPLAVCTWGVVYRNETRRVLLYCFSLACLLTIVVSITRALHQYKLYSMGELSIDTMHYLNAPNIQDVYARMENAWLFFSYLGLSRTVGIHPTYLAFYLAVCTIFLVSEYLASDSPRSYALLMCIFPMLSVIVLLSSKVITFLLPLALLTLVLYHLATKKQNAKTVALVACMTLPWVLLWVNPVSKYRNVDEVQSTSLSVTRNTQYQKSTEIRASLWWTAWTTFQQQNLLFGAGSASVKDAMEKTGRDYGVTNVLSTNDPHSQYLYFLIGNGLIGLSLFLLLYGLAIKNSIWRKDVVGLLTLLLFGAILLTESALELQKGIIFFSVFFPLVCFPVQVEETSSTMNLSRGSY